MRASRPSFTSPVAASARGRSTALRFLGAAQRAGCRRAAILASAASAAVMATAAQADCTANSGGTTVTCSGTSTGYSNVSSGISLTATSGSTVTGPVLLGNSAAVTNEGSISTSTSPTVEVGTNSSIVNDGTIQSTSTTSGSAAVVMGDNGTLTNNGTLTATVGTPVIQFGQSGTFINNSAATAAVSGNIVYGPNVSGGISTLENYNTAFGITGNVYSTGNTSITNDGLFTGQFVQTATGGNVTFDNGAQGTFTGSINSGDTTALTNSGIMTLNSASVLGSAKLGTSSFTNSGTLNVGSGVPTELVVNGAFVNGATGILNMAVESNGAAAPVAGTSYSQIYAAGANGTARLGGTLNIVPTAGFYPTGSLYNIIVADQSITGNFTTVNGSTLPFITFVPVGIVTVGNQQVYEVEAVRSQTYAQALASVATPAQLAIAGGLQPLVAAANADTTGIAATFVGQIDLLTIPQMQTLLNQINPAGYLAYSQALTDQVNLFDRQVMLRAMDPKYDDAQSGYWVSGQGQFHIGSAPTDGSTERTWGINAGFDYSVNHWLIGAAVGYSTATLRNGIDSLTGHNNAYIFGVYGGFRAGPLKAIAQVDYNIGSLATTKTLSLGYTTTTTPATTTTAATTTTTPTNTSVTANPGDHLFKATGTLGFDLKTARIVATPFVGVAYARGAIDGFTEEGGGAADLTVARLNIDRTDLLAGVNVTTRGGDFRPYLRATYRSQIGGDRDPAVSAYFDDLPSTTFSVTDVPTSRHEADIDAGVNVVDEPDRMSVFLGYQGTIRKQMSDHGFMGGVRFQI